MSTKAWFRNLAAEMLEWIKPTEYSEPISGGRNGLSPTVIVFASGGSPPHNRPFAIHGIRKMLQGQRCLLSFRGVKTGPNRVQ